MSASQQLLEAAEARNRSFSGVTGDFRRGRACMPAPAQDADVDALARFAQLARAKGNRPGHSGILHGLPKPAEVADLSGPGRMSPAKGGRLAAHASLRTRPEPTDGAAYVYDGSLEGLCTAIYQAMLAHDSSADIIASGQLQARLGQEVVAVSTNLESASMLRRSLEFCHGTRSFECLRTAAASDEPGKGTVIYRFVRYALCATPRTRCRSCPRKCTCVRACERPAASPLLDDLSTPQVGDFIKLYRSVMNERHLMEQFMRFEHREGDVWFARCNPKASVVPLLMSWFVPRFNDQRFVIYDENHALSGVYDGRSWYLVAGDAITPPPRSADEPVMQQAWRLFYRSVSVEARYNPELRRNFMPMRLWRNLCEAEGRAE